MDMNVCEIFPTILGESSRSGYPVVLVRLAGCNLRCRYCDTAYAYSGGQELPLPEIAGQIRGLGISLVLITGGEPLLQAETPALIEALLDSGFTILVETNGSLPISTIDPRAVIILDQKCPGSGMSDRMDPANLDLIRPHDEIKFVLYDSDDYSFARDLVSKKNLARRSQVIFSPVHGFLPPQTLAEWILRDRLPVRLGIQLHHHIRVK
ncbi:MAG: radical SAM protein [Proteobacteria bacterium]|nr:radical SAM protein [Pseudomonadota bacterium]